MPELRRRTRLERAAACQAFPAFAFVLMRGSLLLLALLPQPLAAFAAALLTIVSALSVLGGNTRIQRVSLSPSSRYRGTVLLYEERTSGHQRHNGKPRLLQASAAGVS